MSTLVVLMLTAEGRWVYAHLRVAPNGAVIVAAP